MTDTPPVIVWFTNDLRLEDNPALHAAIEDGRPLLPVYVWDDTPDQPWSPGGASRWWLHSSLLELRSAIESLGGCLCLRRGNPETVIDTLARETGARSIHVARAFDPGGRKLQQDLARQLDEDGVTLRVFDGTLLHDPESLFTVNGDPYKVFTPFYKAFMRESNVGTPLAAPDNSTDWWREPLHSDALEGFDLLPTKPDWSGPLARAWQPGHRHAAHVLNEFVKESVGAYHEQRDFPALNTTSRLSPYLQHGEISPRVIWHTVQEAAMDRVNLHQGAESFLREVIWREFCHHLLFHWPELPTEPFNKKFQAFPWRDDSERLGAWQRGETGYPLVDAGMRQLWQTGWMHNRVRMVTASFLVKQMLIPWQLGESWFWDTLVDANLANNSAGWQWVAGCGADAAPYFRIFNPVLQGRKFDPEGIYTRHWVPELRELPDRYLHDPARAPATVLDKAGIRLGDNYPRPLVSHEAGRRDALEGYQTLRTTA